MASLTIPRQLAGLLVWLTLGVVVAAVGAAASVQAGAFYGALVRPDWAPPGWLFGPVWTVLYALMSFAAWLVWRDRSPNPARRSALTLFLVQLVFNALWSWLFFGWRLGGAALFDIILLWLLIVATILAFRRINIWAALLLLPYLLWVSFAAALNYAVWQLNPALLA